MQKSHTSRAIVPEPNDSNALEIYLNKQQKDELRAFVGFALQETDSTPLQRLNVYMFEDDAFADSLPKISVQEIAISANADAEAARTLAGRHLLYYGPASLNNQRKLILISRPGEQVIIRGKMSTFGGPNDGGMTPTEGLALVNSNNFNAVRQQYKNSFGHELFLNPTAGALGRNLNPDAFYLATRWGDHGLKHNALLNPGTVITVSNALSGTAVRAFPTDFGPALRTGRVADLSPGLANALGLKTDQECVVRVNLASGLSLPSTTRGITGFKQNLASIASRQFEQFGEFSEDDPPLDRQIRQYYTDLNFSFENVSVPWSAVFVSWCVKHAGATSAEFKFNKRHSVFVHQAIANRQIQGAAFQGFAIHEAESKPDVGDIVQHNRNGNNFDFSFARANADYESHSAIVVDKGEDNDGHFVRTIGGNENTGAHPKGTVNARKVRLNDNGFIVQRPKSPFICVIKTLRA